MNLRIVSGQGVRIELGVVLVLAIVEPHAELGGDHQIVAHTRKRLAQQLFVVVEVLLETVGLGGVEEGVAVLHGLSQQPDSLVFLDGSAVGVGQSHAAQPDSADFQILP